MFYFHLVERMPDLANGTLNVPTKRIKIKHDINFDACCPIKNEIVVGKDLQQINANQSEIQRRVDCFVHRKREDININNIQNFISEGGGEDQGMSCSRTNSTIFTVKESKTYLKGMKQYLLYVDRMSLKMVALKFEQIHQ